MRILRKVFRSFGVDAGEEGLVIRLFLHSALIGCVLILTLTSANALFISTVGPRGLPYVYLSVAVAAPLSSGVFLGLAHRASVLRVSWLTLAVITVVFLGLRVLIGGGDPWLAAFGLMIWFRVAEVLLNLEFWGLAATLLDVRQAKRLYGVIGSGEVLAMMLGGLALPWLVARVGSNGLVVLAAAASALCLPVLFWIRPDRSSSLARVRSIPGERRASGSLGQSAPYVRLILALFLASVLMRFLVDKNFLAVAVERFTTADSLAAFLGVFYASAAAVTLILRSLATGSVLGRFGLGTGLMVLPLSLGLAALATVALEGTNASLLILFWPLAVAKFCDHAFRHSIDRSSVLLLFQPLPSQVRIRAQALAEGVVSPVAAGSAGLLILILERLRSSGPPTLAWWMLAVVGVWIGVAVALRHAFPRILAVALRRRQWVGGTVSADDRASRDVLRRAALDPSSPSEAVYALELLHESDPTFIPTQLPALLTNPNLEVRLHVLGVMERSRHPPSLPWLRTVADAEPNPVLRGAAIRVLAAHDGDRELRLLQEHLNSGHDPVRVGVLVGLLRHGHGETVVVADQALTRLRRSTDPAQRQLVAQVLSETGHGRLSKDLAALLDDGDIEVRRAALRAAGPWVHPSIWTQVVNQLQEPETRQPALLALLRAGAPGVEALTDRLEGNALGQVEELRILRLLARLRHPNSQAALLARLSTSDPAQRHAVLVGLARCGYEPAPGEPVGQGSGAMETELLRDVGFGGWLLRALNDLGERKLDPLVGALITELERCRERILLLLEFLHGGSSIREARLSFWAGSARERAMALELLDAILPPPLQAMTFPLLEGQTTSMALAGMPEKFVPKPLTATQRVLDIIKGRSYSSAYPWLRTCALYCVDVYSTDEDCIDEDCIDEACIDEACIDEDCNDATGSLFSQASPNLNGFTAMTDSATMEKILALKGVDIFASTPSDILLQFANAVDEIQLIPGEELFKQGDLGTSLFVIAEGLVRVHKGDQTVVELGRREIVGELAALDPEPRSASVSAIEPTLLYRIDQDMLSELMADHPEIVQGVIRELAKRLRNTTAAYEAI